MPFPRASGVLLHPTSLPGPYGIGDLGPEAYRWVDFLAGAKQRLWQILPLGPTGYGDSPYQSFSALAGNVYLISPDLLIEDGLLRPKDLPSARNFPLDRVDFGPVIQQRWHLLRRAYTNFEGGAGSPALRSLLEEFIQAQAYWLDDFALFMALKDSHSGRVWSEWEAGLVSRQPEALKQARETLAEAVAAHKFWQFLFFRQWLGLKEYANRAGIKIIGDIPIFVAYDSADVWGHPEIFHLDERGQPTVIAGVPPDYYSSTGQRWGNPLYRWDALKSTGYRWWIDRFRATLMMVDIVRLDHFRGFDAYWEIPAQHDTAEHGEWVPGPGSEFFRAVRASLGELPIIAEDLGVITPGVVALREEFGLPGMKVLHFAFSSDPADPYLPHNYTRNCVVYTGTHDNDTTLGWFRSVSEPERDFCRRYVARDGSDIVWDLIRLAWSSVADTAVVPMQDLLALGTEVRMNLPGQLGGNWSWRLRADQLTDVIRDRLHDLTWLYGRTGDLVSDETKLRPGHSGEAH